MDDFKDLTETQREVNDNKIWLFIDKSLSRAITSENIAYHRQKDIEAIQEFYREVL